MKRILATMFAVTLMAGMSMVASAQTTNQKDKTSGSYESKSTNTTTTDANTTKTTKDTFYGKVEEYQPGKTLKISTPGKSEGTKSFALDTKGETYHLGSVKVGDWVSVTEKADNHGNKVMTVTHSKHAARTQ
jgi:hypothetical protein